MSRQRHVIDDTLFSYVFCIQNTIQNNSQWNRDQTHCFAKIPVHDFHLPESETKSQQADCDARIPGKIFNFCVSFYFLFMEEKLYLASKLIHV